jgi:hypothetical protein
VLNQLRLVIHPITYLSSIFKKKSLFYNITKLKTLNGNSDFSYEESHFPDGSPRILNIWMPFTDVDVDNGNILASSSFLQFYYFQISILQLFISEKYNFPPRWSLSLFYWRPSYLKNKKVVCGSYRVSSILTTTNQNLMSTLGPPPLVASRRVVTRLGFPLALLDH